MRPLRRAWKRLLGTFAGGRQDAELAEEIEAHIAMQAEDNQKLGMTREEARRQAVLKFGGVQLAKENCRDARGFPQLETFWRDLRYAFRGMRRSPGFTAVAVLSLALGIGVNTVVFSLVDQMLWWSLPARDADRLVLIEGGHSGVYPFYREYEERNQVFSGMLASSHQRTASLRPEGAPAAEAGRVQYVSGSYFNTLGVGAAAGRVILPADDIRPGGSAVAVVSYGYWQRHLGGSRGAVGQKLILNKCPLEIVGVAAKGFGGLFNTEQPDAFVPLTMFPVITPAAARAWNTPHMFWLVAMGRLKPGVSIAKAQAGMEVLWPQIDEAGRKPQTFRQEKVRLTPGAHGPLSSRKMANPLALFAAAAGLVLLIACANVANLLLARSTRRQKEMAVRLAIGATRGRLIRQLLCESFALAGLGGVMAVAFGAWGIAGLAKARVLYPDLHFRIGAIVLALSAGITIFTAILFGLLPAFQATRLRLVDRLNGGSATQSGGRLRLGKALIAAQVALSLALLAGAGLFVRTLRNLRNVDLGFRSENAMVVDVDPSNLGYSEQRLRAFYDELIERVRGLRGVRSAGLSVMTPMGEYMMSGFFSAEGYQPKPGETLEAFWNPVSGGYFASMGIPLLLGRDFRPSDEPAVTPGGTLVGAMAGFSGHSDETETTASRVCIIDEALARRLFGSTPAIGRHLCFDDRYTSAGAIEIVGVVKSAHYGSVAKADPLGILYLPCWSRGAEVRVMSLRFTGDAEPVIQGIRGELRSMDPQVPLMRAITMEEDVNVYLTHERLTALLSGFFGILALGLASVGMYGVAAYATSRRTPEIGMRMALGATRGGVVVLVVRDALAPVLIGMAIGLGAALALARLLSSFLYGVAPRDPLSMALATVAVFTAALAAAAIPAYRASRIEPASALRHE